jgi:Tol biopolymer transport system component
MADSDFGNGNDRLDSWKEIATYLKRGVRTVQRWERDAGLPVHRLATEKRGAIYAYKTEIDLWWQTRSGRLESQEALAAQLVPSPGHFRRRTFAWVSVLIVAAIAVTLALLHPQKDLRLEGSRRITFEGSILTPAISPDGKYMAFASSRLNRDANLDLWIGSSGGGDLRRLTSTAEHEFDPDFSADSSRILYSVSEQRPADMLEVTGPPAPQTTSLYESRLSGPAKLVAANAGAGRYSPDGKWIALLRAAPHGDGYEFGVMPAPGGEFIPISIRNSDDDRLQSCSSPVWSPDSRQILMSARTSKALRYEWWLIDVASRVARQTGAVGEMMGAGYPQPVLAGIAPQAWLLDGIVLTKGFGSRAIGIWAVKLDPKSGRLREKPLKLLAPLTELRWFSVAGNRILFNGGETLGGLDVIPFDLDAAHPLAHSSSFRSNNPGGYAFLSLSRDGRTLSFSSRQSLGTTPKAFTVDLDSGKETKIPEASANSTAMQYTAISPDGKIIVYGAVVPNGRPLYIWDSVLGTNSLIMADCGCRPLSWTPDGLGLLVYLPGIRSQPIALFNIKTRSIVEILQSASDGLSAAQVSPDNTRIAFTSSHGTLFVAPFHGSHQTSETEWHQVITGSRVVGFFWSPNAEWLYFAVPDDDGTRILSQRLDRAGRPIGVTAEVQRTKGRSAFGSTLGSVITGAGDRIVAATGTVTTDVWSAKLEGQR